MKGSKLLKVSAILMIIGSVVMIIAGIIALIAVGALALLGGSSALLTVSALLCLVSGICSLIAGIVGVKSAKIPQVATKCVVWGIIVAALSLLGNILGVVGGGSFDFLSLVTGLALPILYIIGALNNNKTAA